MVNFKAIYSSSFAYTYAILENAGMHSLQILYNIYNKSGHTIIKLLHPKQLFF